MEDGMTWRTRGIVVAVGVALLAGSFVAGRYSRPARVVETTHVEDRWHVLVAVWTRTVQATKTKHRADVVTTITPDGTTIVDHSISTTDTHSDTESGSTVDSSGTHEIETTKTTDSRARWALGASWRVLPQPTTLIPQVDVGVRVLGPLWVTGAAGPGAVKGVELRFGARVEL
jgi:hypothetical protein